MTIAILITGAVLILVTLLLALTTNDNLATGPAYASAMKWIIIALIVAACFSIAIDREVIG